MATGKNHQAKKETSFKSRNYSKFSEDRKFEGDDIKNIAKELNKHTCAPIEGYQPLFKKIH